MILRVSAAAVLFAGLMTSAAMAVEAKTSNFAPSAFATDQQILDGRDAAVSTFEREHGTLSPQETAKAAIAAAKQAAMVSTDAPKPAAAPTPSAAPAAPTPVAAAAPEPVDGGEGPTVVELPSKKLAAAGVEPVVKPQMPAVDPEMPVKPMDVVLTEVKDEGFTVLDNGNVAYAPSAKVGESDNFDR